MLRVLERLKQIKSALPLIQSYTIVQKTTYPTGQNPPDEEANQNLSKGPTEDIHNGLYSGGPHHLRVEGVREIIEPQEIAFSTGEEQEEESNDRQLDFDETEEILEGIYSGEPLHLRVDQIKRDAEEIKMMSSQMGYEKNQQNPNESEERMMGSYTSPKKWREMRSERYFPKLKQPPRASTLNELKVETVIRSYWSRGHLAALVDPLYIVRKPMFRPDFPSRTVLRQHRVPVDKETFYHLLPAEAVTLGGGNSRIKLDRLMKRLNAAYCHTVGVEFSYIHDSEAKNWIQNRMETIELRFMHKEQKRHCLEKLIDIDTFCEFIKDKVPTEQMRYIPRGSETSILGVSLLLERAMKKHSARVFVMGMRRLGRYSILAHVLDVNPSIIFTLMQSNIAKTNDVYCLGHHSLAPSWFLKDVLKTVNLVSSCAIPENYYPLTLGVTKGLQTKHRDTEGEKVWPIVIHMAKGLNSQGIIYETLKLNKLYNYETFGTIHVIFNNQMEQTLRRESHMTTEYCTDSLRTTNIPIFHVNGDDLCAVHFTMRMAADFRAAFNRDVAVDIVSYSRLMTERVAVKYEFIKVKQGIAETVPILKKCSQDFLKEGIVTEAEIENWYKESTRKFTEAWNEAPKIEKSTFRDLWSSQMNLDNVYKLEKEYKSDLETGVSLDILQKISNSFCKVPENVNLNPKHEEFLWKRRHLIEQMKLDWVICEALAYGSLLLEGKFVRLSGMDVNRRHHIVRENFSGGREINLLNEIQTEQAKYFHCKSTTSQYATAAFEYGYSTSSTKTLVIWEAPEGDKTSKAQVVIDHYIAGGYLKYNFHSNIVFLIPHYHKCENASKICNGRPERFLQLVNNCETEIEMSVETQMKNTNMILANPSTPANLFHILRRQMYLPYRRPLVIFAPNLLASNSDYRAQLSELIPGTKFKPYMTDDSIKDVSTVKKILLCTGRIYYDLKNKRTARALDESIAICRIEQICPLPYNMINNDLPRFGPVKIVWTQEEPINQGWWTYLEPRLLNLPSVNELECVARPAKADGGSRSSFSCNDEHLTVLDRALKIN